MKNKIGYKTTKIVNGINFSAVKCIGGVEYSLDKKTYRRATCGPLAVFDTYKYAQKFINDYKGNYDHEKYTIFKVKYKESKYKRLWTKIYGKMWFCENIEHYKTPEDCYSIPEGTVYADWVIPIEVM